METTRKSWEQSRQSCHGIISFTVSTATADDIQKLVERIVEESPPWHDADFPPEVRAWIGVAGHVDGAPLVKISLNLLSLKPSQLYAFCGYLDGLALKCAQEGVPGVSKVSSYVVFEPCGNQYDCSEEWAKSHPEHRFN